MSNILVDADALVALAKSDDSNHDLALTLSRQLQEQHIFCLSPFTVAEAATVLSYKLSQAAAVAFLKHIRSLNLPILSLPEKSGTLSDDWFIKQTKKGTSYFDCYNLGLLDYYKNDLLGIFSFDSVYSHNHFHLFNK